MFSRVMKEGSNESQMFPHDRGPNRSHKCFSRSRPKQDAKCQAVTTHTTRPSLSGQASIGNSPTPDCGCSSPPQCKHHSPALQVAMPALGQQQCTRNLASLEKLMRRSLNQLHVTETMLQTTRRVPAFSHHPHIVSKPGPKPHLLSMMPTTCP